MLSRMTAAIVGFIALAFSPVLPSFFTIATLIGFALSLHFALRSRSSSTILAFVIALCYASFYGHWRVAQQLPITMSGGDFIAVVTVKTIPEQRQGFSTYYRFDAVMSDLRCSNDQSENACIIPDSYLRRGLIQLNWYDESPPQLGDVFLGTLRLRRPHGYQSPGAFDYGRWMFASGYSAAGYVRNVGQLDYLQRQSALPTFGLRQHLLARLAEELKVYRHNNIMKALLFADRSGIDRQQWQIFSRTGTSHLMAISGMHIGIVLAWGFLFGRFIGVFLPGRNSLFIGAGLGVIFATGYAALAGFSVPTQRALVMAIVASLAFCMRRTVSVWLIYAMAMLLVLIIDPLAPHRAGFSLSFAAVGVLLFALQGRRYRHFYSGIFHSQCLVLLGLMPLLMVWGYGLNPISFPVNLIAIPLVTMLVLPLLFCGLLLNGVSAALSDLCWHAADVVLEVLLKGLSFAADIFPQLFIAMSPIGLVLGSVAILVMMLPRGMPAKWLALPLLIAIMMAPIPRPREGSVWVTTLDVGQGLSVLIETKTRTLLYDVGPDFDSGFNTADAVVVPALRRFGLATLDMLVLSHADRDHAGAADALLKEIEADELRLGEAIVDFPYALPCNTFSAWEWDGVRFEFLHNQADGSELNQLRGNNASCVLQVSAGGTSVLLTGDIEDDVERYLVASGQPIRAALLIAPHHGSNTSSNMEFIKAVAPEHVVFSAGMNNHYGHPTGAITQRYQQAGARCWSTAQHGSIRFRLGEEGVELDRIWGGRRYYWNDGSSSPDSSKENCSNLNSRR
ncbi:DNA internalization-related competence protein ComEC/Rec2 [Zhongshania sp. BJYM1]|uniref:DNA internalization-related competence protein ComEC/Rec2 n=1 Tax=Zhongshania aquatica TaxID=2965069 RepID=UPI0022B5E21E|nr:DNA internalization-related competence protein ComEC/Rec2 [Marortus sp. BJYM1]